MLLPFLVNSTVTAFPVHKAYNGGQHRRHIEQNAFGILEDCTDAHLLWLKTSLWALDGQIPVQTDAIMVP